MVASKNEDKVAEIESVLGTQGLVGEIVRDLAWPDVEESGATLEENALLKARNVVLATGIAALADDTGLEVDALGGRPGVQTARFAGPSATYQDNVTMLLRVMDGMWNRRAAFRTVVALIWPDGRELVAEGRLEGAIATAPRGRFGFGYDPIFEVDHRTLAQLPPESKNDLSHRARALRALVAQVSALDRETSLSDPSTQSGRLGPPG